MSKVVHSRSTKGAPKNPVAAGIVQVADADFLADGLIAVDVETIS